MPAFLSPTYVGVRGSRIVYDLGGILQITNVGMRVSFFAGASYRRWGNLGIVGTTTVGSTSYDLELYAGAIWSPTQQYRFPVTLNAKQLWFRIDKKIPLPTTFQFYVVTV